MYLVSLFGETSAVPEQAEVKSSDITQFLRPLKKAPAASGSARGIAHGSARGSARGAARATARETSSATVNANETNNNSENRHTVGSKMAADASPAVTYDSDDLIEDSDGD